MSYVYAILAPNIGIKIGFSTYPKRRLANLNTASAVELQLMMVVPGTLSHEAFLLEKLAPYRLRGEWFSLHEDVHSLISKVGAGDWDGFVPVEDCKKKTHWQLDAEEAAEAIQRLSNTLQNSNLTDDPTVWKYLYRPSEPMTEEYIRLMRTLESVAGEVEQSSAQLKQFAATKLKKINELIYGSDADEG